MTTNAHAATPKSITRRTFATLLLAMSAAACVQGKLVHTINFEFAKDACGPLDAAIATFANDNRFKIAGSWDSSSEYWPIWTLNSEDIDVQIMPLNEEPASANEPPPPGPLAYAAHFYDHSPIGAGERMAIVTSAFTRLLGAIEGVRKLGDEQAT